MAIQFTLGIEEEFQVIDPVTRELASHDQRIVAMASHIMGDQVKAEMHQAVVEVGTTICSNIHEARSQVNMLRKTISDIAQDLGLRIGAAGTHPFSAWQNQPITAHPRYDEIVIELQDAARSNLIFGLHVHVGIPDRRMALHIANSLRYFLPHLYALSTNSPFWEGRNTGFKSFRSKVFDKFPRTGIPDHFESIEEHDNFIKLLVKTGCLDNAKKIWWDVRVHPFYPTIEVRICDVPLNTWETIAITAVIQALVAKLFRLREANLGFITYKRTLISENKWRASRYGIDGKLIDFGKEEEVPARDLIRELLEFVDEEVDGLDSRDTLQDVYRILEQGTGADRQLRVYEETQNLHAVVDFILEETVRDVHAYA
ncbi:MAG: carboxylate-amine ligase [Bacteroidia bacterium]